MRVYKGGQGITIMIDDNEKAKSISNLNNLRKINAMKIILFSL
jgi:hypothetical protein